MILSGVPGGNDSMWLLERPCFTVHTLVVLLASAAKLQDPRQNRPAEASAYPTVIKEAGME